MVFYQPTPVRIILEMLNKVEFGKSDCFYDIGSGLGRVVILVALLTEAQAVGVEYETSYVSYAQLSADKLNLSNVSFLNRDASDCDYTHGTIFFLFTPFSGNTFRIVIDKLFLIAQQKPITICSYGTVTSRLTHQDWLDPLSNSEGREYTLGIFKSKTLVEQCLM
jgi:SAM-dependent methyltransferase